LNFIHKTAVEDQGFVPQFDSQAVSTRILKTNTGTMRDSGKHAAAAATFGVAPKNLRADGSPPVRNSRKEM
jgi:hypothetical protein